METGDIASRGNFCLRHLCWLTIGAALLLSALIAPSRSDASEVFSTQLYSFNAIDRGEAGAMAPGPGGDMWVLESSEYPTRWGSVALFAPNGSSQGETWLTSPLPESEEESEPIDLAPGPAETIWITDDGLGVKGENFIDEFGPEGLVRHRIPMHGAGTEGGPQGIASGGDGAVWFTDNRPDSHGRTFIGRITTTGTVTEYPIPTGWGPDLSEHSVPEGLAAGPSGELWFTDDGTNSQGRPLIGTVSTSGEILEHPLLAGAGAPAGITLGSDGAMWFSESTPSRIGRISAGGEVHEYPVPFVTSSLSALAVGPEGNMWFAGGSLGSITPGGVEQSLPAGSIGTWSLSRGSGGVLWFDEPAAGEPEASPTSYVGRVIRTVSPVATSRPALAGSALAGQTLDATPGIWEPQPTTLAYRWQRCSASGEDCVEIAGALAATHLITPAEVGSRLRVIVTATNAAGAGTSASPLSAVVGSAPGPGTVQVLSVVTTRPPTGPAASTITWLFDPGRRQTRVRTLELGNLPAGADVVLSCAGRGCPFAKTALSASRLHCSGHCAPGPVERGGQLNLVPLLHGRKLRPGARLTIRVMQAGRKGRVFAITFRAGRLPLQSEGCLLTGSSTRRAPC